MARPISRRTALKGAGAALALPYLEAMAGPRPGLDRPPVRAAFLFVPNGVVPERWTPTGRDEAYQLGPMLQSLSPFRQDICILENLWHEKTVGRNGHWPKVPAWLSGGYVTRSTGRDLDTGGTSVDQAMAAHTGTATVLPSLELGVDVPRTGIDGVGGGFARIYGSYISWRDPHTPVEREIIPQLAFDRLFRGTPSPILAGVQPDDPRVAMSLQHDDASILDLVTESAKSLQRRVGRADRRKIDQYLEAVRAIERRMQAALHPREKWQNPDTYQVDRPPAGVPKDHREHVRLMLDIIALAFWTDSTRVCTFMLGDAQTGRDFSFLPGVTGGFHKLSHHREQKEIRDQYERICTWHVEQFAYFLERLKSLDEGQGTLLDNCMIQYGSSIKDGNRHTEHDLPLILAGRAGGAFRTGRRIEMPADTPLCNLYVSMLSRMGIAADRFGDSNGSLDDYLLA
ncbi:MAG: DUF1552 domain-containing protein [Planctomycetota bacterium]|nr:MAG: DUF1552 domain-containing protein [Planctomycetota bacterium]